MPTPAYEKKRLEKFGPERFTTEREKRGSQARTTPLRHRLISLQIAIFNFVTV